MSDLNLTAPFAYEALYGLLYNAGQNADPVVPVLFGEVLNYEPATMILVAGIDNHRIDPETIGTYSQIEIYSLTGYASYFQGDASNNGPTSAVSTVTTQVWSIYQSIVMQTVVTNRGQGGIPVLGIPEGTPSPYQILPEYAKFSIGPGMFRNGQQGGTHGIVEWSFECQAYVPNMA